MKKQTRITLIIFISILFLHCGISESYSQISEGSKYDFNTWKYYKKYNKILKKRYIHESMSDDEIAGILLKRGSRNLNLSLLCTGLGFAFSSAAAWLPPLVSKDPDVQQTVQLVTLAVSSGFLITALIEVALAYRKIGDAGIVFQHKKFSIKTTGTSLSFHF
ncbi:MAG: hypothetical protein ISR57_06040 [Bacteroidales bacterium]|nr:hypothetical protein [Bacteroidales bacterium]